MTDFLFAYGTLRPGYAPAEIAATVAKLRPVGEGFVHGVLCDLGDYPGLILDPSSTRRVFGSVLRLPEAADILRRLDEYEGCSPDAPDESLFLRVTQPVILESCSPLLCWIYRYNRPSGSARILEAGRYVRGTAR